VAISPEKARYALCLPVMQLLVRYDCALLKKQAS
jgi:hypothetical protein